MRRYHRGPEHSWSDLMQKGKALDETIKGEVRLCIEGGLAHFPGLAEEQTVSFDDLATLECQEIASLADQADFFSCTPANCSGLQ